MIVISALVCQQIRISSLPHQVVFRLTLAIMIQASVQSASQAMLSLFVPSIAFSIIGAILVFAVRLLRNDPKKGNYKPLPGPKG